MSLLGYDNTQQTLTGEADIYAVNAYIQNLYLGQPPIDITIVLDGFGLDITVLQAEMVTANSNISTLQGQMTTANSNITTLQGQVSTLDGEVIPYSQK